MNRNGHLATILSRLDQHDYSFAHALRDLRYVIDYARGLEEDIRDLEYDAKDSRDRYI